MESSNSKKNVPQLWYWSQPENGFSFEDAETIAKEFVFEARKDKSCLLYTSCCWTRIKSMQLSWETK